MSADPVNREVITLIASAKHENVGISRARVYDMQTAQYPSSSLKVEQFTATVGSYINQLAGGEVVHRLSNMYGPRLANLDSQGAPIMWRIPVRLLLPGHWSCNLSSP